MINKTNWLETIADLPTTYNDIHESVFRANHILNYAVWLLEHGTSGEVVLSMIDELRCLPQKSEGMQR